MFLGILAAMLVSLVAACAGPAAFTQQVEARRLASTLQVDFTKANDAANRAVMADTDQISAEGVKESQDAAQSVARDAQQVRSILTSLGYSPELQLLDAFDTAFTQYRDIDAEVLPLAVENTNLKAQRLSFGPAAEASGEFRKALEGAVKASAPANVARAQLLADRALIALLDIRVVQAPHIAESEDAAMTKMERQMAASEGTVRMALAGLKSMPGAGAQVAAATAAFDRFMAVNKELVALSRRNSNVRSLALSLGRKRMVVARCDDQLRALQDALSKRSLAATR